MVSFRFRRSPPQAQGRELRGPVDVADGLAAGEHHTKRLIVKHDIATGGCHLADVEVRRHRKR